LTPARGLTDDLDRLDDGVLVQSALRELAL
jgi:hypothetical protein